jgi:DNA-binding IclR family transcriptional regulator
MSTPKTLIASVTKAINVLGEVARHPNGAAASEVSSALGMPIGTTHHLLNTLVEAGALTKAGDRRFRLGPKISALGLAYDAQRQMPASLLGPLRWLAQTTGETAYLSGWRGTDIEVLASEEGNHAVRVAGLNRGAHGYAHARASGKLLLAYANPNVREFYLHEHDREPLTEFTTTDAHALEVNFEQIREQGYALDEQEYTLGVTCVSAPTFADGQVIAAFTVSAPSHRFADNRAELISTTVEAARRAGAH